MRASAPLLLPVLLLAAAAAPLLLPVLLLAAAAAPLLLPVLLLAAAAAPAFGDIGAGAARLCQAEATDVVQVKCALRSGDLRFTVDRSATWMRIRCNEHSTFACDELVREARPLLDSYTTDRRTATSRVVDNFVVDNCILPTEQLRCPLSLIGADDTAELGLDSIRGVKPVHLEGLRAVGTVKIDYKYDNNISTVPYEALSQLPFLRGLYVYAAALVLAPDAEHLPLLEQLRRLELLDAGLKALPRGGFRNTPNVESLSLMNNDIEYVDEDAFLGLSRLVNMTLHYSRVPALPPSALHRCRRLERLELQGNQLELLPAPLLQGLPHLKEVEILSNRATLRVDNGVFANLPSLHRVALSDSPIQTLPEQLFHNSTALRQLDLSYNAFQSLPSGIFRGLQLQQLDLSSNKLERLPADVFCGQDMLQHLDLSHNKLTQLNEGLFRQAKNLRVLVLKDNELETLDESVFTGLAQLRELELSRNRLHHITSATLHMDGLVTLSLARNNLSLGCSESAGRFDVSPLRLLAKVQTLDLSHNRVETICYDWKWLPKLRTLDLSYNRITSLSISDLDFRGDVSVNVDHNLISHFQPKMYFLSYSPPTFHLNHNPFICDCKLYDFIRLRAARANITKVNIDHAVCSEPPSLKNTFLTKLSPDDIVCDEADCPTGCSCLFRPATAQIETECPVLPVAFSPKLQMFSKRLRLLQASDLLRLTSDVSYVDLSGLNLTEAPRVNRSLEIDLSKNRLRDFPIDLLKQNCTLDLEDNLFECGCSKIDELEFLKIHRHLVRNYTSIVCDDGVLVAGIEVDRLCVARDYTVVGCAIALLGLSVAVVTAAAYRYKTEARILLRMVGLWRGRDEVHDKPYDAFVSFAYQDQRYVEETLVPALEGGRRPLRLLLHQRDWVVGDFIPTQIASSVDDSRRTIIVLSRHFLQSMWAQMEFQTAHGSDKLIILMLEDADELRALCALDADLRAYLALHTYVRADDPLVSERLKDAVLRRRRAFARTRERTDEQVEETRV